MRFLYVFALIFISVFGMAALVHVLYRALFESSVRKFEIYVKNNEYITELLENLRSNPNIGKVFVIADSTDEKTRALFARYPDVEIIGESEFAERNR